MSKPKPADEKLKDWSRALRAQSPVPERILWGVLRNRQLDGLKFRRQVRIAGYIADFVCESARVVVELDGMTHVGRGAAYDVRSGHLAAAGYRVVRVTNDDVLQDLAAVCEYIARVCQTPSPASGRGPG